MPSRYTANDNHAAHAIPAQTTCPYGAKSYFRHNGSVINQVSTGQTNPTTI
ncbi:hypothetical protein [Bartonella sp. AC134YNZD]|uniref:hypothetical protein n=1 Tax=Bartonella sp. AC134YNZD TaxID=3243446 RepID=UPI0035D0BCC1